jgi:hypothetical protein
MTAAGVNSAVAQQEGEQLLAFAAQIVRCRLACPDEIAHRLVNRVRHPHPGQFAGPEQPRQYHRIAPVGLDPLARPLRDQGRRDHQAGVPESLDLAIQPVSGWPRIVAQMQLAIAAGQLADQPLHRRRRVRHLTEKPHLAAATAIGNRYRVLHLRDIESDKGLAILSHGPPSVHEARLGLPEQPSLLLMHEWAGRRPQPGDITSRAAAPPGGRQVPAPIGEAGSPVSKPKRAPPGDHHRAAQTGHGGRSSARRLSELSRMPGHFRLVLPADKGGRVYPAPAVFAPASTFAKAWRLLPVAGTRGLSGAPVPDYLSRTPYPGYMNVRSRRSPLSTRHSRLK